MPERGRRRAAPEGAGPGRARQPAGLRGPDRAAAGSRVNGEVAVLGRRVDPEVDVDRGRRRADRREGRASSTTCSTSRPGVDHHGRRPAGPADRRRPRAGRAAGVPGRPARRRHRGPAAAHQRRRPHPPAHPPELRRRQGVPRRGRGRARTGARSAGCARASSSTTARTAPAKVALLDAAPAAHHDPRGPQPPGPAHVRGGRPSRCVRLVRTRIGPLTDRTLEPGEWRPLTQDEVRALERAAAGKRPQVTSTLVPAAVRALRGATTVDDDEEAHVHERVDRAARGDVRAQRRRPRRHHQHPLHRHRRHPRHVPGRRRPQDGPRRRAADLRPGARHRRRHAPRASGC